MISKKEREDMVSKIFENKKLIYSISGVLIAVLFLTSSYFFCRYQLTAPAGEAKEQSFIIEKYSSLKEIAIGLDEAGLIKNRFVFTAYIYYKGWAGKLQAGEYILDPALNSIQVARKIVGGDIVFNEVQVTIPEGFDLKQIDARLAAAGLISEGNLLAQSRKLEGYLFPDTYRFDQYESLNSIITKMEDNFDSKMEDLLPDIEKQGKTLDEIIIMASILEKEVKTYYDKQVASGLFWKRITNNYPLQSCATIAYILGVDKWKYSYDDLEIDSPYNTYQNTGLPPGPICNPGLGSIKAAIYPIATNYNFFLSKPGTGETIFSQTAEEHNANKIKYLQ